VLRTCRSVRSSPAISLPSRALRPAPGPIEARAQGTSGGRDTRSHSGAVDIEVRQAKRAPRAPLQVAGRLWDACIGTVLSRLTELRMESMSQGSVIIGLEPALGEHQETRLRLPRRRQLDNVRVNVLDME